jgi:hypothetical protein
VTGQIVVVTTIKGMHGIHTGGGEGGQHVRSL